MLHWYSSLIFHFLNVSRHKLSKLIIREVRVFCVFCIKVKIASREKWNEMRKHRLRTLVCEGSTPSPWKCNYKCSFSARKSVRDQNILWIQTAAMSLAHNEVFGSEYLSVVIRARKSWHMWVRRPFLSSLRVSSGQQISVRVIQQLITSKEQQTILSRNSDKWKKTRALLQQDFLQRPPHRCLFVFKRKAQVNPRPSSHTYQDKQR